MMFVTVAAESIYRIKLPWPKAKLLRVRIQSLRDTRAILLSGLSRVRAVEIIQSSF